MFGLYTCFILATNPLSFGFVNPERVKFNPRLTPAATGSVFKKTPGEFEPFIVTTPVLAVKL